MKHNFSNPLMLQPMHLWLSFSYLKKYNCYQEVKTQYITSFSKGTVIMFSLNHDFFAEEFNFIREEYWKVIKENSQLIFLILTKEYNFKNKLPKDWDKGYENVIIDLTISSQTEANDKLPIFNSIPLKHRQLSLVPLKEKITLLHLLQDTFYDIIQVGGTEFFLDYNWIIYLQEQAKKLNINFCFVQTGKECYKNGIKLYDDEPFYHSLVCYQEGLDLHNQDIKYKILA